MKPIDLVLGKLPSAKQYEGYWKALCPAHEDKQPSLSICSGDADRVLLKCHANCATKAILAALGLSLSDLYPPKAPQAGKREIHAIYPYLDEQGTLLFQVCRYKPKQFRQRQPDSSGKGWIWNLKGVRRVLYRLPDLGKAIEQEQSVFVTEGEKDVDALVGLGLCATCNSSGAGKWQPEYTESLRGAHVVVLPDNDEAGGAHGEQVARACLEIAASVRILKLPGLPDKGDVSDWLEMGGTADALLALAGETPPLTLSSSVPLPALTATNQSPATPPLFWEPPRSLAVELAPVPALTEDLLPVQLRPWLLDTCRRMGCPLEFIAIPALIALGSVIGTRLAIRPKQFDNWTEYPNLWGLIVGRPSSMKSPAMSEGLRFLRKLEQIAIDKFEEENRSGMSKLIEIQGLKASLQQQLKEKKLTPTDRQRLAEELALLEQDSQKQPIQRRYLINDSTVEKLGELLRDTPRGLCVFRDELIGLLSTMERKGHESDRGFFLEAWNGKGSFTYDRIGRGTVRIPQLCLSMIGGIQPERLRTYVRDTLANNGDDGFIARFQLMVFPDNATTPHLDCPPDMDALHKAEELYCSLDTLDLTQFAVETDSYSGAVYLRFAKEAQTCFYDWLTAFTSRLQNLSSEPSMESHLSKYRKLVPALALLFHLADGEKGPVSLGALRRSLAWADLLEAHARRVYLSLQDDFQNTAGMLALRLPQLPNPFTCRQVVQKGWSGLATTTEAHGALTYLEDRGWIKAEEITPGLNGGRPSTVFHVHPEVLKKKEGPPTYNRLQNLQNKQPNGETF